jgi:hypothetical protein
MRDNERHKMQKVHAAFRADFSMNEYTVLP